MVDLNRPAHFVEKGDPRVDGPYLDDIAVAQREARHNVRNKLSSPVFPPVAASSDSEETDSTPRNGVNGLNDSALCQATEGNQICILLREHKGDHKFVESDDEAVYHDDTLFDDDDSDEEDADK